MRVLEESGGVTEVILELHLNADVLGRWVPSGGATATDFVKGAYTVSPAVYTMSVSDSFDTATVNVV